MMMTGDGNLVDLLVTVRFTVTSPRVYLFEAANARHEHEYAVWESVKLPEGKLLAPGVVSHATKLVEHPELMQRPVVRSGRKAVIARPATRALEFLGS